MATRFSQRVMFEKQRNAQRLYVPHTEEDNTAEEENTRDPSTVPAASTSQRKGRVPKCKKGQRYKVPGCWFDEDSGDESDHPEFFYGVVTEVQKTGCKMLFNICTIYY